MYIVVVDPLLALAGFAILALLAGYWAHRLAMGVPFRPIISLLGAALCLGSFCLVESGTWLGFADTAPVDLVLLSLAGVAGTAYAYAASRIIRFTDGRTGYRSGAAVPLAWFLLLVLAIITEVACLGQVTVVNTVEIQGIPDPTFGFGASLGATGAIALAVVDALFAVSTGLVLGQASGVHVRFAHRWWIHVSSSAKRPAGR
ncbi:MAG: hypothetical protein L3J96_03760 [Thermoplasmata archaeon]|nr:hypothetical protein [Thermoplasmata archaeon]